MIKPVNVVAATTSLKKTVNFSGFRFNEQRNFHIRCKLGTVWQFYIRCGKEKRGSAFHNPLPLHHLPPNGITLVEHFLENGMVVILLLNVPIETIILCCFNTILQLPINSGN
jgi:hypothetical protein